MDRQTCSHCRKQFKTESGLAYHLGWAHKSTPSLKNPEDPKALVFQQLPSPKAQAALLSQIQEQLGQLQQHVWEEHLGEENDCTQCLEIVKRVAHRGIVIGAESIFAIPGAREANAFNNWARSRNGDIVNWFDVPGVKDALTSYQGMEEGSQEVDPSLDDFFEVWGVDPAGGEEGDSLFRHLGWDG